MKQPTPRVIEAMTQLENDNDFQYILDWIEQSSDEINSSLLSADDASYMRQCQGAVRELREIISVAGNARNTLNKMR